MTRKIKIYDMTSEDKETLKEIIEHCQKLEALIDSLSSKARANIRALEGDLKESFVFVGTYADTLQSLLNVDP